MATTVNSTQKAYFPLEQSDDVPLPLTSLQKTLFECLYLKLQRKNNFSSF